MHYTVKQEDTDMGANLVSTLVEVGTVIGIVGLCAVMSRAGYREYGVLIAGVTLIYYVLVAYVKLMFSRLKVGTTYKFETTSFGINLTVDKHNIVWIPVLVFKGAEEKLNLYSLSLTVKEEQDEH